MQASELLIGVDGGGTKTVACLATNEETASPTILGRGTAGPSNLQVVGESVATENLNQAIAAAFHAADVDSGQVASACLGLAGADRDEDRLVIRRWADQTGLAKRVQIVHDALPVLYAGTEDGSGVALISGTGSFAFGRDAAGSVARCGGWGYLLGDEGSGYAIALDGLRAAARSADGRGPQTCLLERFLKHLDLRNTSELISVIYTGTTDRMTIADLAQVVFEACDSGDAVAGELIRQAARELAELVTTIAAALKLSGDIPLALTGGVLLNQHSLRVSLLKELAESDSRSYSMTTVTDPVVGAIRIAQGCL